MLNRLLAGPSLS
nr:unnamed protein product [Callosobruchus analis]